MIEQLTGDIVHKNIDSVIISVCGVGYKVHITPPTITSLPQNSKVTLWTYLAVRENALDLYGFLQESDLRFFELLLTISGIGPKSALGILSVADIPTLKNAVSTGDTSYLTKVSGIGNKSANRIVIELKDKVHTEAGKDNINEDADTLDALVAMGYSATEVRDILKQLPAEVTETSKRIKEALKLLAK